ncbi:MAG: alpha-mannosidase [Deltaproteobacteria bacterium]|nr:alpha-mannosidase [Deltaproteobacteria bacterium]
MGIKIFSALLIAFTCLPIHAQEQDQLKIQYDFIQQTDGWFEGFEQSTGVNDFKYHSLRNDVTCSFLTRAKNGDMPVEWSTQIIPENYQAGGAWFLWLAAVDITDKEVKFDVYVNDAKRFTITSGDRNIWKYENDGGVLQFITFQTDQHGDAHGYMSMYAPDNWYTPGMPLNIKIIGEPAGENTWIIIYKAKDALAYLRASAEYETWLDVAITPDAEDYLVEIEAPAYYSGKDLHYETASRTGSVKLNQRDETASGSFHITSGDVDQRFILTGSSGKLVHLESLNIETTTQKILSKTVLINTLKKEGSKTFIRSRRLYKPGTVEHILNLVDSKLSHGSIYLMNSSHQDIAWMDSPENCIIERDTMLITPLLEKALGNDKYRFDIEDALMIKEYVERHPEKKGVIGKLLKEGKISCGSSYIQPYEEMYSGEALIRQFYFGTRWLKSEFGYNADTYWNVDVPGRTLQMPQILKKSGTDYMMISRHEKGLFNWFSPDGSFVTTFSPGHYGDAYTPLHKDFYEAAEYLAKSALDWDTYYSSASGDAVIPVLSDWDMSPAKDYSHIINSWESFNQIELEDGRTIPVSLPRFKISTGPEFFRAISTAVDTIPSIQGERPALWLYIHGPAHQKALKASREGDILLTMAEKFAAVDALTEGSFVNYPEQRLHKAWEAKIYPDHGWGGKKGQITDDLFRRKFEFARSEAKQVLGNATRSISSKIETNRKMGIPVVVFNSLSWKRTDIAEFQIGFNEGKALSITLKDTDGNGLPAQYRVEEQYPDGSIKKANVSFIAGDIPSIGYKTYYVQTSAEKARFNHESTFENRFYQIEFSDGGLKSIYDKQFQIELIESSRFSAGEVFTMQSEGTGAGEFAAVEQPTMEGFDKTGDHSGSWVPLETGAVFSSWKKRSELPHAAIEQKITLYHTIKRIDFEIALLNWEGILYREFRMALPLKMENGQVAYEVPFGVVEVGKDELEGAAGERYYVPAKDIHPRGIVNWIGASDGSLGVTLSSSVAVADYIDPTDKQNSRTMLQPILLASRRSCHGEGNEYLQTGNHFFSFSMSSHQSAGMDGPRFGTQANEKLVVVINPKPYRDAYLPGEQSFLSIDMDNIFISTLKKCEEENGVIIRCYDVLGKNTEAEITLFKPFARAYHTNLIEEGKKEIPVKNNKVKINIGHHSIETIKLK